MNGPLVQVGSVNGDVTFQLRAADQRLREALDTATMRLGRGKGVAVAENLVLTCVELAEEQGLRVQRLGTALALAEVEFSGQATACVAVGVPSGQQALVRLSDDIGAPVLNQLTGAVCGVYDGKDVAALPWVPERIAEAGRANHAWLDLLDDDQLREGRWRHPGEQLRRYLKAIGAADEEHAYRFLRALAPPLSAIYVERRTVRNSESDEESERGAVQRLRADELLHHHPGVQIVDAPGMGKSSLVRRMTADVAQNWLQHGRDELVPVLVPADVLALPEPLPNALAKGAVRWFSLSLSSQEIVELFNNEPTPGVQWLVLVDGLDEIAGRSQRREVLRKIADHREDARYRFVVTSRPLQHDDIGRIEQASFPSYRIEPFTAAELKEFASRFLAAQDGAAGGSAADFMDHVRRTEMHALARVPLISTMLCTLYADKPAAELPRNQSQLYGEFLEWTRTKRNELDVRAKLRTSIGGGGQAAAAAVDSVLDGLDELLQYLAYRRQGIDGRPAGRSLLDDALHWAESLKPSAVSHLEWTELLSDALRQSGLLSQAGGTEFEFLHKTLEEYLAARELAARYPDPNRRAARRLLDIRQERPGRRVKIFLAAHWIENGADLNRYLRRILRGRRWRANGFLTELIRYGFPITDEKLQRRVERLLCREVRKHTSPAIEWKDAVEQLEVVDPDLAVFELEKLADRDKTTEGRCLEALRELVTRGVRSVPQLTESFLTHSAITDRSRTALVQTLGEHDPELAAALLTKIAAEIVGGTNRVRAAELLITVDEVRGREMLSAFAADRAFDDRSRVRAAESLLKTAPAADAQLLPALLHDVEAPEPWKQAAELLYQQDADALRELLAEIAGEDGLTPAQRRYEAASMLVERFELGHDRLLETALDRRLDHNLRIEVVVRAGQWNPQTAVTIVLDLLKLASPFDSVRLTALEALLPIEPETAHAELTKLARAHTQTVENRFHAVELGAGQSDWDRADICVRIARTHGRRKPRLKAAHAAAKFDRSRAEQAFRGLVEDSALTNEQRINAATAAQKYGDRLGSDLLTTLARDQHFAPDGKLQATEQLKGHSPGRHQQVMLELVGDDALPRGHRVQAAKKSRNQPEAVTRLAKIAAGRSDDSTRLAAAHVLSGLDRSRAAEAFRHIENQRKTGRRAKQEARHEADKLERG